jgi:20S proteasome subunit alpha 7
MAGAGTGYDLSVGTFSSDGRLFQVEYACKAIDNSGTAVGICCKDGVVVGVEKILAYRMMEKGSDSRVFGVDRQAGVAICGMLPDGKNVVDRAREEAAQMRSVFGVPLTGKELSERIGSYMHLHTCYGMVRPFGCTALLASYSDDGPQLFVCDPTGTVAGYNGCALGKAKTVAKTALEKLDFTTITCREAVKEICAILYDVHDSAKDRIWDVQLGWVCEESKHVFQAVPEDLIPPKP